MVMTLDLLQPNLTSFRNLMSYIVCYPFFFCIYLWNVNFSKKSMDIYFLYIFNRCFCREGHLNKK
jgi:hypothetical protein